MLVSPDARLASPFDPSLCTRQLIFVALPTAVYFARRRHGLEAISRLEGRQANVITQVRSFHRLLTASTAFSRSRFFITQLQEIGHNRRERVRVALGGSKAKEEAAIRLQSAARRKIKRRQVNDIVITRKRQLYGVSWPILLALFVFLIGDVVIVDSAVLGCDEPFLFGVGASHGSAERRSLPATSFF